MPLISEKIYYCLNGCQWLSNRDYENHTTDHFVVVSANYFNKLKDDVIDLIDRWEEEDK